jgi:uncharacterized protein YrrD
MQLASAIGEKVVSKSSAETLGTVEGVVIDPEPRTITAVRLGKGRKARLVSWGSITGFGPDAVVVENDDAVREPNDELEARWTDGGIGLIGARVLSDRGNEHGAIADIEFDETSGALIAIEPTRGNGLPAERLLAVGSYAWIVSAADDEAQPAL